MTTTLVPVQLLTSALIALLERPVSGGGTGRAVFDQRWKGTTPTFPYVVVRRVGGVPGEGPFLTAPDADPTIHYQVDAVGSRRDQAEKLDDRVREAVLGRTETGGFRTTLNLPGWVICERSSLGVAPVDVHGTPPNETFVVPSQYALSLTPE